MHSLPPLDQSQVAAFIQRLDPVRVREVARRKTAEIAAVDERRAADLLPPDLRPTPPPKR